MPAVGKTIADVRADVCDAVFAWMIPAGAVGVGMSLSRVFEHGWLPIMNFHLGLMVLLVVIYIARKKIPYGLRAGLLVAIMFMIGVGGHVSFGSPTALVYFISASIMGAVLFGERIGVATVALSVISIMGIYGLFMGEVLPPPRLTAGPLVFTTWLTNTAAALVASLGPLISVSRFRRYLDAERRRAEAASTAKSDFLATMSHELRTPMTAVLGIADLLLADNLPVQQSEKVGRIAKSGRVLLSLLNDMLDFSKIEAGRLVIERVPFSLQDVICEVRELMTPLADEKHLAFEVSIAPDMTDGLLGDPIRLRQIMINLHVLLVDDDASFLDLLEALLKNFGITHIVRASSGQDAYKILSEPDCSITCVLCDISMAHGTGLELLQIVRSGKGHLARPDVTFILITAIEDDELRTTARLLGANGFLLKPVTEERLREAMQPTRLRDVFQPIRRMLER